MARTNMGISGFARVTNNLQKMGYFPTTEKDAELIGTWLHGYRFVMLDPCCGDGKAIEQISRNIKGFGSVVGIEIEKKRAEEARERGLDAVLNEDFLSVSFQPGSIGCVFVNPPYDTVEQTHYQFIVRATDALCENCQGNQGGLSSRNKVDLSGRRDGHW